MCPMCGGLEPRIDPAPLTRSLCTAQQRLIEQLQAQLRGDAPSQQASGCDAETAAKMKAAAEVQAKEVAQLKQQVAKLTQQNKDLSVELAATKSAGTCPHTCRRQLSAFTG